MKKCPICRLPVHVCPGHGAIQSSDDLRGRGKRRSDYKVVHFDGDSVWIVDLCNERKRLSVTNDADGVCAELGLHYSGRRIFYRDTSGEWDEIVHDCGKFINFKSGTDGRQPPVVS